MIDSSSSSSSSSTVGVVVLIRYYFLLILCNDGTVRTIQMVVSGVICYLLWGMRHDPSSNLTMMLLVGTITSHHCRWGNGKSNSIRYCCCSPPKMLLLLLLLLMMMISMSMSMIMMILLQYAVIEYLLFLGWLVARSVRYYRLSFVVSVYVTVTVTITILCLCFYWC